MRNSPPSLANKLLLWFSRDAFIEDIIGDMEEVYEHDLETMSVAMANYHYWRQVLALLFSYALRKRKNDQTFHPLSFTQTNNTAMFKNYVKVAIRSLARNKFFTIINVLGLSLGMSVTILFIGFTASILKYDKFHKHYENIYRITSIETKNAIATQLASTPMPISDVLANEYNGFDKTVKINTWASGPVLYGNKELPMHGYFTEPNFFEIFSFEMLNGNSKTALSKPYQVIMTSKAATRLFSGADPIGKVITVANYGEFTVSGVMADIPKGSSLNFEILVSYATIPMLERDRKISQISNEWYNFHDNYTYVLAEKEQVSALKQILNKIGANRYNKTDDIKATFDLQPIGNIVTTWDDYRNDLSPYFGGMTLFVFGGITLLILLPACFNYSNISISRALKRAKEIGIRKVVGGYKKQIWLQFITETIIICLIALLGSLGILVLIKQRFVDMLGQGGSVNFEITTMMMIAFVVFAILTGFLAGVIPASYFSRIEPVTALKGGSNMKLYGKTSFKKVLIISQFALSLFFIIGVVVQFRQLYYSINYDMGFNQDNLLDVDLQDSDREIFKNEFSKNSAVQSISMSSHILGTQSFDQSWLYFTDRKDSVEISQMFIDQNYLKNLGLTIVAGTDFIDENTHDESSIIINETFYKMEGFTNAQDALDQVFLLDDGKQVKVIGVVKDFNYALLRNPIDHFVLRYNPDQFRYANIKVNTSDNFAMLTDMENTWKGIGQEQKFEAKFFDTEIEDAFKGYTEMIEIFSFMGFLAITIACLGLLGMVVYGTETRSKEVGIRKVMGASVQNLVYLLSREYLYLMFIAALFAMPISYVFFNLMLANVQYYSITVGIIDFGLGLGFLFFIGIITLASQTIKTAQSNPVDTLKCE